MVEEQLYTDIEKLVLQYLINHQINFQFATSIRGGFYEMGGAVVDFIIPDDMLAFRVQGEYWHSGVEKRGSDIIQREMLTELGYVVIDLWSDDLLNRLEETMTRALRGEEMLK